MSSSPHSSSYSDALAEGSTVDRYTIQRMLGKGGFGITYLVAETSSDQTNLLALKESIPEHLVVRTPGDQTLHVRTGKQEDYAYATGTFLAEAQTLSQLDHPHIIKVHRAFEQNHTVYFTMDYLEGGSLADEDKKRLKHNTQSEQPDKPRWSESDLLALLDPLLDALEYLHAKDILHRDIKPDNILLSSQGQPILADFGAAKLNISEHTHAQTIVGTAGYTPIEQRGQQGNNTGAWSDLYALGATCYYLMTGKPPVMAEDRVNQKRAPHIPLTKRTDMAHYSHALRSSIDRALLFDHERRWQTASAWRKQLHAIESKQQRPRSSKLPWLITLLTLSASIASYLHHREQISSLQAQLTVEITRNQTTRERIEKLSEKYSSKPAPPVSRPPAPATPLASPSHYALEIPSGGELRMDPPSGRQDPPLSPPSLHREENRLD